MKHLKTFEYFFYEPSNSEIEQFLDKWNLKTYNRFINEKFNLKSPDKLVKLFSSNVSKDFTNFITDNKKFFKPFVNKYINNGVIDMQKISNDFKIAFESSNESVVLDRIIQFLKSIIKLPVNIFNQLIEFLKPLIPLFQSSNEGFRDTMFWDLLIEPWRNREWGTGILTSIMGLIVAFFIYILSYFIYINVEHAIDGLDKGVIVSEISFEPAHTDIVPTTISDGKTTTTIFVPVNIPDTWSFDVKSIKKDRIERWSTSSPTLSNTIEKGDTLNADNFSFVDTKKE